MTQPDASIIIPVWNQWHRLTEPLLERLGVDADVRSLAEIVVADDGSTDDTRQQPSTSAYRMVHRRRRGGFAAACTSGAAAACGETLVFLNNDTQPQPGWLPPLLAATNAGAGMAGSRILLPAGQRWRPMEWGKVTGACFATPRRLWKRLGGFEVEAGLTHGMEDTDYGLRCSAAGAPIVWITESRVLHLVGQSTRQTTARWRRVRYERACDAITTRWGPEWWWRWRESLVIHPGKSFTGPRATVLVPYRSQHEGPLQQALAAWLLRDPVVRVYAQLVIVDVPEHTPAAWGTAIEAAAAQASTPYLVVAPPWARGRPEWLLPLVEALDDHAGVAGPLVRFGEAPLGGLAPDPLNARVTWPQDCLGSTYLATPVHLLRTLGWPADRPTLDIAAAAYCAAVRQTGSAVVLRSDAIVYINATDGFAPALTCGPYAE